MTIIHRYILRQFLSTLMLTISALCALFIMFDFFDRVDTFFQEGASVGMVLQYFIFKLPLIMSLMLPISMLVTTMLCIGLLSKSSEITAMRAAGLSIGWLARPILITGFILSVGSIIFNETVVPYATRRVNEVYQIDIKQKDKRGGFSRSDMWWRSGNEFYTAASFDSRSNTLAELTRFDLNDEFEVTRRTDAVRVRWVPQFGWSMHEVAEYRFPESAAPEMRKLGAYPLPIKETPEDMYDVKTDPHTMSFRSLRRYIQTQQKNGLSTREYVADLYDKIAFPFISFIVVLLALPFALKPERTGSMAPSFVAGLCIGFSYYVVHSFSISMGRAEILPPFVAAWMANIVMGAVGAILLWGADAP